MGWWGAQACIISGVAFWCIGIYMTDQSCVHAMWFWQKEGGRAHGWKEAGRGRKEENSHADGCSIYAMPLYICVLYICMVAVRAMPSVGVIKACICHAHTPAVPSSCTPHTMHTCLPHTPPSSLTLFPHLALLQLPPLCPFLTLHLGISDHSCR